MTPTIYSLESDYARYGLTREEAQVLLRKKFDGRHDWDAGITGEPWEIVLHIQDGSTVGSLRYWLGKQASATVMANRDGSILKVIPERDGPWTNGDVQNPLPEAAQVLAKGGNPNIWTLSIEAEGHPWEGLTAAQLDAIEWQIREWMRIYRIPFTQFRVIRHRAINSVTRYNCPGANDTTDYYLAMVKRIGTGLPTTQYADPVTYSWMTDDELEKGIDRVIGSTTIKACRRLWEVKKQTPRRQSASLTAKKVGPDLQPGDTFMGEFVFKQSSGWWILTRWGTRVFMGDMTESVVITDV